MSSQLFEVALDLISTELTGRAFCSPDRYLTHSVLNGRIWQKKKPADRASRHKKVVGGGLELPTLGFQPMLYQLSYPTISVCSVYTILLRIGTEREKIG